jgi:hypothetical protein
MAAAALCLSASAAASAQVYYAGPSGSDSLSANSAAPGSLAFAVANAPSGSTVILENGSYDGAPQGFTVTVSGVTFRAQHWHKAIVENTTGAVLWEADPHKGAHAVDDICQGIVFGPCVKPVSGGWSGGGSDGWQFLDCEFTHNDGIDFGNHGLVLHCLFTDQWLNSFDVNGVTGFIMRNSIARRGNRMNGDSDSIGNKEDFADNLTFDGLIAYDNEGTALWFDTANKNWLVKNCTFFANHGGNNWYTLTTKAGISTTQLTGSGQDDAGVSVGKKLMAVTGTPANRGFQTTVTAVTGYHPMTITVSPALPVTPTSGDIFAVQPNGMSGGYGLMSEANANGTFIDNVTYNNTDGGLFDADSGDGYQVEKGGLVITGNQFDYDGIAFRSITGGPNNPTRKLGPAVVTDNKFKIGAMTAKNAFHWGGTNWLQGFPHPFYHIDFDDNTYDPDPDYTGPWVAWYLWSGGPTHTYYNAGSLTDLQNPATFDQDHHSAVGSVPFRGQTVASYTWPTAKDTDWKDIYFPNNVYGATDSIHQVNDDETPYIQNAVTGKHAGQSVTFTVFGHTPFEGNGPFTCEVYDYSGCWARLNLPNAAAKSRLDAAVPPYAVLTPSTIRVKLTSAGPYGIAAIYPTSSSGRRK